jgi:two-component sensor histidine kinase
VKLRDAKEELASIEARIEALAVEHRKLEDRRTLLFALLDQLLEDTPDC